MPKYIVYGLIHATKIVGEYEADTKLEAMKIAEEEDDSSVNICHQCSKEIELGDVYGYDADEI